MVTASVIHYKNRQACQIASVVSDSLQSYGLNLLDSSVHGILQERILEWVVVPSSRGSSQPRD